MREILTLLSTLTILNCASQNINLSPISTDYSGVSIVQKGKRINITENFTELVLDKSNFTLEFEVFPYNPEKKNWYAAEIAATLDKENLKYFQEGAIDDKNPFFSPGAGMAGYSNESYSAMYIGDSGHHYIYYENDSSKRADLVLKRDDGKIRLKWDIISLSEDDKETKIAKSKLKELYIMIFIDNNLNEIIENGEYNLLLVKFK